MKKIIYIFLMMFILSACTSKDCQTRCNNIKPIKDEAWDFNKVPKLPTGCYWGGLKGKLFGTPEGWVHYGEGSRGAVWCPPNPDFIKDCDC
jgi:hypothetical protein